jgi:hypothetical protein
VNVLHQRQIHADDFNVFREIYETSFIFTKKKIVLEVNNLRSAG